MGSETPAPLVDKANVAIDESIGRSNKGKVPKRTHKAEREKLKREHLNELFLELASALELTQLNNGKASILCEAARLLKDLFGQIQSLEKENASLLSESQYVTTEKNELREEISVLETQIEKLQSEIEVRMAQSKPDLNVPPPEFQQSELTSHFPGHGLGVSAADPALQQASAVLVVPLRPDLHAYPMPDTTLLAKPTPHVSKPHARYPTPADSWPFNLLGEQPIASKDDGLHKGTGTNL